MEALLRCEVSETTKRALDGLEPAGGLYRFSGGQTVDVGKDAPALPTHFLDGKNGPARVPDHPVSSLRRTKSTLTNEEGGRRALKYDHVQQYSLRSELPGRDWRSVILMQEEVEPERPDTAASTQSVYRPVSETEIRAFSRAQ